MRRNSAEGIRAFFSFFKKWHFLVDITTLLSIDDYRKCACFGFQFDVGTARTGFTEIHIKFMMMAFYLKSGDFVDIVNIVFIRNKHIIAQTMSMLERITINDGKMPAEKIPAIEMRPKLYQLLPIKMWTMMHFYHRVRSNILMKKIGGFAF